MRQIVRNFLRTQFQVYKVSGDLSSNFSARAAGFFAVLRFYDLRKFYENRKSIETINLQKGAISGKKSKIPNNE